MDLLEVGNIALQAGLSPMAAMAAMAIAKTEGGLNGAVGDNGQSFGPFQFYSGGQLKNFARDLGISMAEAGRVAQTDPARAVAWALRPGGYLGDTLRRGEAQGLRGADLATHAQRHGQVSVSPERSGQNFTTLFGDGQEIAAAGAPAQRQGPVKMPPGFKPPGLPVRMPAPATAGGTPVKMPSGPLPIAGQAPVKMPGGFNPRDGGGWGAVADGSFIGAAERPSQFTMGGGQLTKEEAAAWCGPAAAMAFAASYGRTPTLAEAKQMAASLGWSAGRGMAGPGSTSQLLSRMGVPNEYQPWSQGAGDNWARVRQQVGTGKPVILDTPGHYFYATKYDPTKDSYYVGTSGSDLTGGSDWLTPQQMTSFAVSGPVRGAIYGA